MEIKNGVMCQFRDGGQPWTLAEGETVRFSLTAGLVEGYEERGQPMEIGVLRDGARVPLFNGNLNVTMDMHVTAPADGSYEFYCSTSARTASICWMSRCSEQKKSPPGPLLRPGRAFTLRITCSGRRR